MALPVLLLLRLCFIFLSLVLPGCVKVWAPGRAVVLRMAPADRRHPSGVHRGRRGTLAAAKLPRRARLTARRCRASRPHRLIAVARCVPAHFVGGYLSLAPFAEGGL